MNKKIFYVDGACSGNPGPGGFGVALYQNDIYMQGYQEFFENTTNNRMELSAILYVMRNYGQVNSNTWTISPIVYTDSAYAFNTYTNWMFSWERNNWLKSNQQTPENLDIITEYFNLYHQGYRIQLKLIKGHSGIEGNEKADALATGRIKI